ncbi:MAG TPA: proton-conducting transporter membrane subunit [Oculatellaceae cyanobacterium]
MLAVCSLLFTVIAFLFIAAATVAFFDWWQQRRSVHKLPESGVSSRNFDHSLPSIALFVCGLAMFVAAVYGWSQEINWNLPWPITLVLAPAACRLDALSAVFIGVFGIALCAVALCATRFLQASAKPINVGEHWIGIFLLACGTLTVTLASNAPTFVYAWLIVVLALGYLFRSSESSSRPGKANLALLNVGAVSLISISMACYWMTSTSQTFDFSGWAFADHYSLVPAMLFFLGLISIGGLCPFHDRFVRAQESTPITATVMVNALLMPSVMYSIIRLLIMHGLASQTLGYLFLSIGLFTAVWCSLMAVLQQRLTVVSRFVSLQNAALALVGIAFTLIGRMVHLPVVSALGLTAALFFSVTSSLSTTLLFFAAASIEEYGDESNASEGINRGLPWFNFFVLIGAAALAGVPTLSGFDCRWLLYHAAFQSASTGESITLAVVMFAVIAVFGSIAGLTFWAFVKPIAKRLSAATIRSTAYSVDGAAATALTTKDAKGLNRIALVVLAGACFGLGLIGTPALLLLRPICYAAKCGGLTTFPIPIGIFACAIGMLTCFIYFLKEDKPSPDADDADADNTDSHDTSSQSEDSVDADKSMTDSVPLKADTQVVELHPVQTADLEQPGRFALNKLCASMVQFSSWLQSCSVTSYCLFVILTMTLILLVGVFA